MTGFSSILFAALLFLASTTITSAAPNPFHPIKRQSDAPVKYFAVGDSYAAGNGAGKATGSFLDESWWCARADGAYGHQLNNMLNNPGGRNFQHKGCSTYTAEQVMSNFPVDGDTDIATLTAGGNNIGFGDLIDACIYRFWGVRSADCNSTMTQVEDNINDDSKLWNPVWNEAWSILDKTKDNPNFRLYVTSYIRYWNSETDQCDNDDAVWNWWTGPGTNNVMKKERRRKMNSMADLMNGKLQNVVDNLRRSDPRIIFVNYDSKFEGHRFCEEGVKEPQPYDDPVRDSVWSFQYHGATGQVDGDEWIGNDPWGSTAKIQEALQNDPTLQINPIYGDIPDFAEKNPTQAAPIKLAKVFHPTSNGHKVIAEAIKAAHDTQVTCGSNYGPCDENDCDGMNNPDGQFGICQGGSWNGCTCRSTCGSDNGSCDQDGCEGQDGKCTAGGYKGCNCDHIEGNQNPDPSSWVCRFRICW